MAGASRRRPWLFVAAFLVAASPASARTGPTVRELVQVADIEALAVSPDGRRVAFRVQRPSVAANTYRIEWYVADIAKGQVRRVADGGAPIYTNGLIETERPVWSTDGRFIYRRALVQGRIGIWRTATDGSGSRLAIGGDADVESLSASQDGRSFTYVTGPTRAEIVAAERREYDEGILIDASIDPFQATYRGGWEHGRLASERLTGEWFSRGGLLWNAPRIKHRVDLATLRETGRETIVPPEPGRMSRAATLPDLHVDSEAGRRATVVGAGADQHLEVLDPQARVTAICNTGPCRGAKIVALAWRPRSDELLFTRQDLNFRQSLYRWHIGTGATGRVAGGEGQFSGGRSETEPCAVTHDAAVCVAAGPVSPPRLVRIDVDRGVAHALFDPNRTLRARTQPAVEQLTLTLDDGRSATGTLLYPPGPLPAKAPLFVTYYYCPGYLRGGTGDPYPLAPLVDAGFVVACLNSVPMNEWRDGADVNRNGLAGVSALVRLLVGRGWIDPARVGMGGFSMGSEATMWVARYSKLLAAAAVASPQYEPSAYWMESLRGRDVPAVMREFQQAGTPEADPERWKVISPALATDRITAPLLMQLPEQEIRSAMELYSKLSNTKTPVELYAFPDEAHIKLQPVHMYAVYRRNLDWFRYWRQDYVDPDPALAAQYHRWDLLRRRRDGSGE